MTRERIGETLKSLRKSCGLNQTQAHELSGVSRRTWSAVERGEKSPTVDTLALMLGAVGGAIEIVPTPIEIEAAWICMKCQSHCCTPIGSALDTFQCECGVVVEIRDYGKTVTYRNLDRASAQRIAEQHGTELENGETFSLRITKEDISDAH